MMISEHEFLEKLRRSGMKMTPQRIIIVRAIIRYADEHPSINRIYSAAQAVMPTISFSTVYSTIKRLEELGLIKLFDWMGKTRIEANRRPHLNIIDASTGSIRDVEAPDLVRVVADRIGVKEHRILVNVIVYGGAGEGGENASG